MIDLRAYLLIVFPKQGNEYGNVIIPVIFAWVLDHFFAEDILSLWQSVSHRWTASWTDLYRLLTQSRLFLWKNWQLLWSEFSIPFTFKLNCQQALYLTSLLYMLFIRCLLINDWQGKSERLHQWSVKMQND